MESRVTDRGGEEGRASPHRAALARVAGAMRAGEALSLEEMAAQAHLSPYHFARIFKQETGVSPGEFGSAVRLQRAKEILLTTDLSASEACFEVGYTSFGTFSARFSQLVGVSPGRMRRLPGELRAALGGDLAGAAGGIGAASRSGVAGGVAFEVRGDVPPGSCVFVGLFPGAVPQRVPVAGAVLTDTAATYRLGPIPDGEYHIMAAALPRFGDPVELLLPGDSLRVGRGDGPVPVRRGRSAGLASIRMRPMGSLDPPLLLALPALLTRSSTFDRSHSWPPGVT